MYINYKSQILEAVGYIKTDKEDKADFVIYNTCTVRENANQRVYGRLGYLGSMKKKKPHMMIALCGCMMQEAHVVEKLKKSYRFVDLIFGTHNIFKFPELLCYAMESDRMIIDVWKDTDQIVEDLPVDRKYKFKSGVNIMFGCNNFCSYCIVPYVRGRERSRNPGETEEDFLETMDVVGKVGYDSAFTFIYSKRSGTPAAAKENQVPEEVVKDRFDRLFQTDSSGRMQGILLYGNTCRIENITVHSDICLNIIE